MENSIRIITALLYIIILLLLACEKKPPADITDPAHLLFLGYVKKEVDCAKCHGPEGQGTMKAPNLVHAFEKYNEDEILDIIEFGAGEGEDVMPPFEGKLDDRELSQLLQFLKDLQAPTRNIPVDSLSK